MIYLEAVVSAAKKRKKKKKVEQTKKKLEAPQNLRTMWSSTDQLIVCLFNCLIVWLFDYLTIWTFERLIVNVFDCLIVWLTDWLTNWLTNSSTTGAGTKPATTIAPAESWRARRTSLGTRTRRRVWDTLNVFELDPKTGHRLANLSKVSKKIHTYIHTPALLAHLLLLKPSRPALRRCKKRHVHYAAGSLEFSALSTGIYGSLFCRRSRWPETHENLVSTFNGEEVERGRGGFSS